MEINLENISNVTELLASLGRERNAKKKKKQNTTLPAE
jgi:hypothetical protein